MLRKIQRTDNYYVIVSREGLSSLPYSVEEIYGIRTSGKYGTLKQSYHEFYRIYGQDVLQNEVKPEMVITEDIKAIILKQMDKIMLDWKASGDYEQKLS